MVCKMFGRKNSQEFDTRSKVSFDIKYQTNDVILPTLVEKSGVAVKEQQTMNGYRKLPPIVEEMSDTRPPDEPNRAREDATGHLLCWGCGEFGQHGHGYKKEVPFLDGAVELFCGVPENRVKHVACGSSHSAVVTSNNELYLWGNGNSGQLGLNDLNTRQEPNKVSLYANQAGQPGIAGVSCGGRHTVVWLDNGHVFSFGNNFHAQLGYDFRKKNYKENQTQPTLLKFLTHRAVTQVACGDKHTMFRFKDGGLACVGNNAHGQIGSENREDTLVPKFMETFQQPVVNIAAGSQHSLAVTDVGEVYVWGYGKACGSKRDDILSPVKLTTSRRNVISVAGGSSHSMALTANGSVYTWGCGQDGQLGHGDKVKFLAMPRRVKDRHITCKCIQIACGETFSSAITEKGLLYMWGKNSHTIIPDKPTTFKIFLPYGVNKNFRGGRIERIFCGSWHAMVLIGRPELLLRDGDESGESDTEHIPTPEEVDAIFNENDELDYEDDEEEMDVAFTNTGDNREIPGRISTREDTKLEREKTSVSIADFYAPTPDIKQGRTPSPEFYRVNSTMEEDDLKTDRAVPSTARSATLVVQLPVQPMTTYADAACSPMTLTTTSSNKSSSVTTLSRVPSPLLETVPYKPILRSNRGILRPEKKFKEFDPVKYEKEKLRITTPVVSEIVQVSKTSADAFTLPREPTSLARKHVDFSEMEEIRLNGPKSPEKLSRISKHKERREPSPLKFRDPSPTKYKEPLSSRSRLRHIDSSLSFKSDSALMESPLFKSGGMRTVSTTDQRKKPWKAVSPDEERQYRHHVPKQLPRKYKPSKNSDSNFGLQISRSKTIVTSLQSDGFESPDRLAQLRRYAAMHNPQSTSGRVINDKLKPVKSRHVSIPTGRADSPVDEADRLCIGTLGAKQTRDQTWKDKSDIDKFQPPRKVAAGIVRMYLATNDVVGTVDSQLYSSLSDGRGHADPLLDGDPFIVQPLMKKKVPKIPESTSTIQLPELVNTQNLNASLKDTSKRVDERGTVDNEGLDAGFSNTARAEILDSRVS